MALRDDFVIKLKEQINSLNIEIDKTQNKMNSAKGKNKTSIEKKLNKLKEKKLMYNIVCN